MDYAELKNFIEAYLGLDKDALHIHAALLLYLMAMFVFRGHSKLPWLFVLAVEIANEAADLVGHHLHIIEAGYEPLPFPWSDSMRDLWNTMLWPTLIQILHRHTDFFGREPASPAVDAPEPADFPDDDS